MEQVELDQYEKEVTCTYKGRIYQVRDNGAVLRLPKIEGKPRGLDNQWSFGKEHQNGYLRISSETIHRIVATAFHGDPPSNQYVVDHIDTNRKNNRPENLRWVTKFENLFLNQITLSRIIYKYGSIDNFFNDPSKPIKGKLDPNYEWMRRVTKEEAENTKQNLLRWAKEGKISKGGQLGEWIFFKQHASRDEPSKEELVIESITPNAIQKKWKTPAEFPFCPQESNENSIKSYAENLAIGGVFSRTKYSTSVILDFALSEDGNTMWVLCEFSEENSIKPWSLAEVTYENNSFVHSNLGSFFEKDGAEKQFTILQGLEWTGGDTFDDFC